MTKKIVVTKNLKLYDDQIKRLKSLGEVTFHNNDPETVDEWFERCKDADIICTGLFGIKSERVYNLKDVFISLPLVSVEFLDKERLKKNNITVANSPGCNKEAVAEWIVGVMLMHFRRLCQLTRTSDMPKVDVLRTGIGLWNKKITILGAGNIGKHLGRICESFGMEVTFFKRGNDLLESAKDADIVVNCLSVNETTKGLLDKKFFSSLKKGTFFISTSKPLIYDFEALKDALDKDILIAAADDSANTEVGDVNEQEYKELLKHPKILVTPHIAWNTDSKRRKSNDMMIDNIEAWLKGTPINVLD